MNKIKFLKSSSYYKYYLLNFYQRFPHLKEASYNEQYKSLMNDCFAWSDFWKTHLEKTGDFIVEELVINNKNLQIQWAKEHNQKFNQVNWFEDILKAQLLEFKPDIWFAHSNEITPEFRNEIRKEIPNLKIIIGFDGTLMNNKDYFEGCDIVMSCIDDTVNYYQSNGYIGYFLPYAFEKSILRRISPNKNKINTSFVGSFYPFKGLHSERLKFIVNLDKKIDLKIYAPKILKENYRKFIWTSSKLIKNLQFKDLYYSNYIDNKIVDTVYGIEMFKVLANSKTTINIHGDLVKTKGGNMRLFEATGAGACLITDWKENLSDFFVPDKEVVVFKSFEECVDKITYLLNNQNELDKISKAGQQRTLRDYSYENVINKFSDYIKKIFYNSEL